ncbi:highly derived D5-like helicase-primase [Brazilian marseillevirus]|uniref:highly derived D5-like helicase-primase n=1 Tax=Brazilian marseillevirus TaxID=1813599 RepID=UPI000782C61E|nr:highly derived D5-like helicase-primase [Brazilian marseillevirus]AMQ10570.1 highly derived D5-like helicase-primase [Brazilian marseillevirus]
MRASPQKDDSRCTKISGLTDLYVAGKLFVQKESLFSLYRECFEGCSLTPKRGYSIVSKDVGDNGCKLSAVFLRKDVFPYIKRLGHLERNLYELVPGSVPRIPYFDIDAPRTGGEDEGRGKDILDTTLKHIAYIFRECFGKTLGKDEISKFTSSTKSKDSFHVYINNYFFSNKEDAKEFTNRVKMSLAEEGKGYEQFLDNRVYSSWQPIRLMKCHKRGKPLDSTKKAMTKNPKLFICDVEGCERLPSLVQTKIQVYLRQDIVPSSEREEEALEVLYKLPGAEDSLEHKKTIDRDSHLILNFNMVCPWHCPICDREHDNASNLNSAYVVVGPVNIWLKCRSASANKKEGEEEPKFLLLGRKRKERNGIQPCLIDPDEHWYWSNFASEYSEKRYRTHDEMKEDIIPNMRRVFSFIPGHGDVVVKANKENCFKLHKISFVKSSPIKFFLGEGENVLPISLSKFFQRHHLSFASQGMTFFPYSPYEDISRIPIEYINTFEGFKAHPKDEEIDMEKLRLLLSHIKEVWADGSEENYVYILSWLSVIIKNPREKTGIALVILSDSQGAGKGVITDFLLDKVFGRKLGTCIGDLERVVHRFNSVLNNRLLVVLDEVRAVDASDYHKSFDVIKHLITEKTVQIEKKGVETSEEPSFVNFLLTTNNSFVVKVEQSDRRYAMFRCSDKRAKDFDYFSGLCKALDYECASNFMKFLLEFEGVNIKKIPETGLKEECRTSSKTPIQLFLEDFSAEEYEKDDEGWILATEIYQDFTIWAQQNGYRNIPNMSVFGKSTVRNFEKKRGRVGGKVSSLWRHIG